jgi:hypothetical protein
MPGFIARSLTMTRSASAFFLSLSARSASTCIASGSSGTAALTRFASA